MDKCDMQPPISQTEIDKRISNHIDELLRLWWAEQGASKPKDLELIASVIPSPTRVLDLCCGPGDVGRAIRRLHPNVHVDFIDRDPFLTSICRQRDFIAGKVVVRDLNVDGWVDELAGDYDAVAVVNALHWFDAARAERIAKDVHGMLRAGGMFVIAEPVAAETPFSAGFEEWKARQPPRYSQENWKRFWFRANALLGYDHIALLGSRDAERIGDGMTVAGWIGLLERAGFVHTDVLLRDADQVVIGAIRRSVYHPGRRSPQPPEW